LYEEFSCATVRGGGFDGQVIVDDRRGSAGGQRDTFVEDVGYPEDFSADFDLDGSETSARVVSVQSDGAADAGGDAEEGEDRLDISGFFKKEYLYLR
jgi:hypothetical protein